MKQQYRITSLFRWILPLLICTGCHQEPVIPESAIPATCRINELITINEGARDTTTFLYTPFGLVEKSSYRQWINGQLVLSTDLLFSYSSDYYLVSQAEYTSTRTSDGNLTQVNKGYLYAYQNGLVQEVIILDNTSNAKLGFREYTYEGDNLKTYTELNGAKALLKRYTFDGTGKLTNYEEPNSGVTYSIANGKIRQRNFPDGSIATYDFDAEGQLTKQIVTAGTSQIQFAYTYDRNPYWTKTQLRFRGIPTPDLGDHLAVHNTLTYSQQQYQANKLISNLNFTYNHAYNKAGYSQGYGRSDGMRQINYYTNCP